MESMAEENDGAEIADRPAKKVELVVAVILLPRLLMMLHLHYVVANTLGVLLACVLVYLMPPRSRASLKEWAVTGLLAAIFVFVFTGMVNLIG